MQKRVIKKKYPIVLITPFYFDANYAKPKRYPSCPISKKKAILKQLGRYNSRQTNVNQNNKNIGGFHYAKNY